MGDQTISLYWMATMERMTVEEFIAKLRLALNSKTLYVLGGWGAPLTAENKERYINKNSYNRRRKAMIEKVSSDTFAFDCVNLGKGILWGWNANPNKSNGGAVYGSNGVPDTNETGMYTNYCYDKSTNFKNVEVGEFLWMKGHCGYYIGNGLAIECSPKWKNGVQITAVGNMGKVDGYNTRTWKAHGKWKFLDYTAKRITIYRLYNLGEKHIFTSDQNEVDALIKRGWKYEGVGWIAPSQGDPVYRLYNKNNGDHLLTTNAAERDDLVRLGLKLEGVAFRSATAKDHPVHRLYNPNSGEHFYTMNAAEKDMLIRRGWKGEGIGFYALAK